MKLLHTADIHLGYETHGRLDPETGLNTRLQDFARSFRFMAERAIEEDVDLFLFCGDAYRTADPTPTQQQLFAECLKPVADAGIPIAMVIGNHDHPVTFGKASAVDIFGLLAGNVRVFRKPDMAVMETKAGPLQLIALPWPIRSLVLSKDEHRGKTPEEIRTYIEGLYADYARRQSEALDPALPAVLAAHLTVEGAEVSGSERTSIIAHEPKFTVGQLALPGIDYVALGHIHKFQDRNREAYERGDGPPVVYPSSIERISFKEADAQKGFVIVEIDRQPDGRKRTSYRFVETPARRFVSVDVPIPEGEDPTTALLAAIARAEVSDAVVRVRYEVDEGRAALVDTRAVREALAAAHAVAAVERIAEPPERKRTTGIRKEASLADALRAYVGQREELKPLEADLLAAAAALEADLDAR
jgi:DNA repair protein SbcD/Mre11